MAYTTINKSTDYFNPVAYAGDGTSDRPVTSGFATDFVWIKNRNTTDDHVLFNKIRGGTKYIYTNNNQAESTYSSLDLTFESTGVDVGSYTTINNNGSNLISYHWKANGAGVTNTAGSINSTVSANTTAGFSIVSYTGTGANATVGHGLGSACKFIMIKRLNSTNDWEIGSTALGWDKHLYFTVGSANSNSNRFQDTAPTNSLFYIGNGAGVNASSSPLIAYCFANVKGFSKIGNYTGNGNVDGTFVYTGFKPAFVMAKRTDDNGDWIMCDNGRNVSNVVNKKLFTNLAQAEDSYDSFDFVSNGFKIRSSGTGHNASGGNYIYIAFAEAPLVGTNGVTAKAR